ncbi:hypothetical protein GTW51_10035 [Aurantimonas aggregata]|uniref:Uncharacterized protein n=1 Tax=Aurantimonas aggregata TaxID=2047720 RepID=A0A6L9MHU3_9HYPH|nr:hypothetical protein [Aurantimonas aggregata]NDV87040.1 hypothetical protein [Aurantimonas aggregata]
MVARPGTGQQSMNAGELAEDLAGRVDIKQYYSAGLRYLNVEPIPQAGFRNINGTRRIGLSTASAAPRFFKLKRSRTESFHIGIAPGRLEIFKDFVLVAIVSIPAITAPIAAEAGIYAEADTIGIFHKDLESVRVLRESDAVWTVDSWPYERIPDVDYGGVYAQTSDVWIVYIRWAEDNDARVVTLTVDGETTAPVTTTGDDGLIDYPAFAAELQAALEDLPSLGVGVTVTAANSAGGNSMEATITFGGDFTGAEYDLSAQIVNTSEASALAAHSVIGDTEGEPAISASRGWPGFATIIQDRLLYAALRAKPSGLLFSQVGEYFNVNTEAQRADGAKLEAIRTNSTEEILHVEDSKYVLLFTDEKEYFITDRVIERDKPLNIVKTTENGLARGTVPVEIENRIYYVGQRGGVLFSTAYDDISSAFTARMESLLAFHLVENIVMTALQRGSENTDATKLWMLRADGRLISATVIRDQEITAFYEYSVGAPVLSVSVDASNRLWLVVQRADGLAYEILSPDTYLFSAAVKVSNGAGVVTGLHHANGATVYAETASGYTIGPFTISGGAIATGWPGETMTVGEWVAPVWQSMPRVKVNRDDTITRRPGRIHTLKVNVIATTSIAIGANDTPPIDVPLLTTADPVDAPMPAKTQLVTVAGIPGTVLDTTAVITQRRPGPLRVRDVTFEEKL